jgi:hypothetical protein
MNKYLIILLLIIITACGKEPQLETLHIKNIQFNDQIQNSIWTLQEIEFQNQIYYYKDTLTFLQDSIYLYNGEISIYELYRTSIDSYRLRLRNSPVGYIDTDISSDNLISGNLYKHTFYNVFIISNKFKITLKRLQ